MKYLASVIAIAIMLFLTPASAEAQYGCCQQSPFGSQFGGFGGGQFGGQIHPAAFGGGGFGGQFGGGFGGSPFAGQFGGGFGGSPFASQCSPFAGQFGGGFGGGGFVGGQSFGAPPLLQFILRRQLCRRLGCGDPPFPF